MACPCKEESRPFEAQDVLEAGATKRRRKVAAMRGRDMGTGGHDPDRVGTSYIVPLQRTSRRGRDLRFAECLA
jgi:hypothetical protein